MSAAERFRLGFATTEREATSYSDHLRDADAAIVYRVRVERAP